MALLMAASVCAGTLCVNVGAQSSGASSSGDMIAEDASQGAVTQEGDMVCLTLKNGAVVTFTSAHLGGTVSFTEPDPFYNGQQVELKIILAEPGCIGYATSPSGEVYTGVEEDVYFAYQLCRYYGVNSDGTFGIEGYSDNTLVGNTYYCFGTEGQTWGYSVLMTTFYADDGRYWITTQEVVDRFTQLTGIQVEGGPQELPQQVFSDVAPDAWYAGFVQTVYEKGLFTGAGDGTFAPEANMDYAQFLTVLSQFSGETISGVPGGAWYDGYVNWAKEKGLIPQEMLAGFNPTAAITRQDMAALFGAFLKAYNVSYDKVTEEDCAYTDAASIAGYAADGVNVCYQAGIMSGGDDGSFAPMATATRAQVAVTMVQMARVMGR